VLPLFLSKILEQIADQFQQAGLYFGHGTDNAWDEAIALAIHVLQLPPNVPASEASRILLPSEVDQLWALAEQRIATRKPVPYLTQEAWFAGLKFYVDERVLIPRSPIAECIARQFQPWAVIDKPITRILDLCTGSACIAIACAMAYPKAQIDALDISEDALAVARTNIMQHQVADRVSLYSGDLWEPCVRHGLGPYDLIMSNPPYIPDQDLATFPTEYHWEPENALISGADGLSCVRKILAQAVHHLNPGGLACIEVGAEHAALEAAYPQFPFTWVDFECGGEGVFIATREELQTCLF
jgi:ribosomal protein L3 glutamine methyltransferase